MMITVNETGARTLAEARPMRIAGQNVYVVVDAGTASLMVSGRIVAERAADGMNTTEAQTWAADYRDAMNEDADARTAAFADEITATVSPAVVQIRDAGQQLLVEADKLAAHGEGDYRHRSALDGRMRTYHNADPRHPARAAVTLRTRAAVLMAWTDEDESGYGQYVSQGIGDTDGYYTPVARDSWKAFVAG
jgi:hypothetical protein